MKRWGRVFKAMKGRGEWQDNEGYTFPDAHTAKGEAVKYAAELLSDVGESFWDPRDFEMTVTDEKGLILFTIRMIGT